MGVSFQGGQAVPAVGTAAYAQAQQGSGSGSFDARSGVLTINGAPVNPATQSVNPKSDMATSGTAKNVQTAPPVIANSPIAQTPAAVDTSSQGTAPLIGAPNMQQQPTPATQPGGMTPQTAPLSSEQVGQKYAQGFAQAKASSAPAPQVGSEGRSLVSNATSNFQTPQAPYQPTPQFMQSGDPIMQSFIQSAMAYQDDTIRTGYTAKALEASFANQLQGIDLQAANLQNIMNGTRDDIRAEIGKAGGFATESQIEGLTTTRNRDLLKQYNNIELQKQTMQNQMQMQVSLAKADHQYAVDKYDQVLKTTTLYKGIYDNTTDQIDKLVQNVGYTGIAQAYNNDPYALSLVEQHLKMPAGTLSDPQSLQSLDTYRQQSLAMSQTRLGQAQTRLNITIGNNTPNQAAVNAELQSYKTTGIVPPLKNQAQANAFWTAAGGDPDIIGNANASKALRTAATASLKNQTTQYEATKTAIGTVDKQLDLLSSYVNGDPAKGLQAVDRSGIPLVNRYKNFISGNYGGDPQVTALNNVIQTASSEFAKILGGSAASISGTPVSTQHDAQNLLNASMTTGQLNTVINLMRQEGKYRLQSQGDTINEIQNRIKSIGQGGNGDQVQGSTQLMTGPDGKKFNVPADKVDLFKQNGYK